MTRNEKEERVDVYEVNIWRRLVLKFCSKAYVTRLLWLYICILLCLPGAKGCKFPKFLETTAMWMTHNDQGNRVQGYFRGQFITASRCNSDGTNCEHSQIKCLNKLEDNKYQVKHSSKASEAPLYSCMQILRRSDNIIQIRESQRHLFRSPNACNNEHLILDNWPMTSSENFEKQKIPCPFSGGYNIRFHTSDKQPKCATEIMPTRLESECEQGDGMEIKFHSEDCIDPALEMEKEQALYCAATWIHGNNTFVVVRPQSDKYKLWCLRFHGSNLNSGLTKAEIFIDFVCDPGDGNGVLRETSNYLEIEFEQKVISSTCSDAYGFCGEVRLCQQETYNSHCRKACGECSGPQNQCNFLPKFEGEWIEQERGEQEIITVTTYTLFVSYSGKFTCHEKDLYHDFVNDTMLLQTFENGCFPRYSCLEIHKPFSSILEYRIGNRVTWPVKNWDLLRDDVCDESMFLANRKDKEIYGKGIYEKPMKILVDPKFHYRVNCKFEDWAGFDLKKVYMQNENGCDVCLLHDHSKRQDSIITQTLNCSSPKDQRHDFHCIGVFPQDDTTHAVVTRKLHAHQEYTCWVFVFGHQRTDLAGTVYVLESSFCNSVAIEAVKEGNVQPLETYNIPKNPPQPCPYIPYDNPETPPSTRNPLEVTRRPGPVVTRIWPESQDQERPQPTEPTERWIPNLTYDPNRRPPTDPAPKTDGLASSDSHVLRVPHWSVFTVALFLVSHWIIS